MKKFAYSVAALMALGSFASAGGMITEPEAAPVPVAAVSDSGPYIGVAYGAATVEDYYTDSVNYQYDETLDTDFDTIMLQAGYKFNKYLALEGRYWTSLGNGDSKYGDPYGNGNWRFGDLTINDYDFDAWGIYVKPMYPVTEEVDVYALLGYAGVKSKSKNYSGTPDVLELDKNGFSWGVGVAYSFTDNISVFVDYVSLLDDKLAYTADEVGTDDVKAYSVNVGVTYKF